MKERHSISTALLQLLGEMRSSEGDLLDLAAEGHVILGIVLADLGRINGLDLLTGLRCDKRSPQARVSSAHACTHTNRRHK
jgi:hypothetical protein